MWKCCEHNISQINYNFICKNKLLRRSYLNLYQLNLKKLELSVQSFILGDQKSLKKKKIIYIYINFWPSQGFIWPLELKVVPLLLKYHIVISANKSNQQP